MFCLNSCFIYKSVARHLVYATQDSVDFEKIDLKKTKDVFVRKDSKNLCLPTGFTKEDRQFKKVPF